MSAYEIGTGPRAGLVRVAGQWLRAISGGLGGGRAPRAPDRQPVPDPESDAAKKKAAEERQKLQQRRGTSKTVATSPQGVLGAAPVSRPELKGTLG